MDLHVIVKTSIYYILYWIQSLTINYLHRRLFIFCSLLLSVPQIIDYLLNAVCDTVANFWPVAKIHIKWAVSPMGFPARSFSAYSWYGGGFFLPVAHCKGFPQYSSTHSPNPAVLSVLGAFSLWISFTKAEIFCGHQWLQRIWYREMFIISLFVS